MTTCVIGADGKQYFLSNGRLITPPPGAPTCFMPYPVVPAPLARPYKMWSEPRVIDVPQYRATSVITPQPRAQQPVPAPIPIPAPQAPSCDLKVQRDQQAQINTLQQQLAAAGVTPSSLQDRQGQYTKAVTDCNTNPQYKNRDACNVLVDREYPEFSRGLGLYANLTDQELNNEAYLGAYTPQAPPPPPRTQLIAPAPIPSISRTSTRTQLVAPAPTPAQVEEEISGGAPPPPPPPSGPINIGRASPGRPPVDLGTALAQRQPLQTLCPDSQVRDPVTGLCSAPCGAGYYYSASSRGCVPVAGQAQQSTLADLQARIQSRRGVIAPATDGAVTSYPYPLPRQRFRQ